MLSRVLLVVVLLISGAACSSGTPAKPKPSPTPSTVAELNTTGMDLVRTDFCKAIPPAAVKAAIGSVTAPESWTNGGELAGSREIAQEFGCRWTDEATGVSAAAWVFARPLDQVEAKQVVKDYRRPGCRVEDAMFGAPGLRQTCGREQQSVRYAGLVGDTFVTCEIRGPQSRADLATKVEPWCATVVTSVNVG